MNRRPGGLGALKEEEAPSMILPVRHAISISAGQTGQSLSNLAGVQLL